MEKIGKEIEMNMLRDRATPLPSVTDGMFESCNPHNVELVKEYLATSNTLSKETLKQYKSGIYQFTYYIKENLNDKPFYKISKRDFKRYMSYLVSRGLSSNGLKFKKSSVSAFCSKFIEVLIVDDMKEYETFRNFTTGVIDIPANQVYSKVPIIKEECDLIIETLLADENYLAACWVSMMFNVGCRRAEGLLFKSEIVNYENYGKGYILSHKVRSKGRGEDGKQNEYMIPDETIAMMKLWLEKRGYEHEYIYTIGKGDNVRVLDKSWCNRLCQDILSDIIGRRITVHNFKASCITHLLNQGKDMKVVSKYVAKHSQISTTQAFYDLRDDTEEMESLFE